MKSLQIVFNNIERFYTHYKSELIGNNSDLRPSKTTPRDIFAAVNKFKEFYLANKISSIAKNRIPSEILGLSGTSDTVISNLRIIREFDFALEKNDEYIFTDSFLKFIDSNISIEEYYLQKIKELKDISDFRMIYNAALCVLREGYIYDEITVFPESLDKFKSACTDQVKRSEFCKRVYETYGFIGKYGKGNIEDPDYTPNINYRFITPLHNLGLIEPIKSSKSFGIYKLTEKGLLLLKKIDRNLTTETTEAVMYGKLRFKTEYKSKYERNRIVFGAPGTGKSYELKDDCRKLLKHTTGTYERVTFHPDYAYSHFVGTYKPVTNDEGEVKYEFVPGPFMRVYVAALKSGRTQQPQPHILLIEEINRAKVAAVFGDVFQLLDRDDDGVSEYEIHGSEDIRKYLAKELDCAPEDFNRISLPDNMFIWATMNSADQGVFPMDTAFKRRWNFEYLGINKNDEKIKGKIILGKDQHALEVKWNQLRKAINEKLAEDYKVNEDKLIGPYFLSKKVIKVVSDTDYTIADPDKFKDAFKNKIIMYLYEDAAKQHKNKLFDGCNSAGYSTAKYSSVCDAFDEIGIDIFGDGFKELYDNQGV